MRISDIYVQRAKHPRTIYVYSNAETLSHQVFIFSVPLCLCVLQILFLCAKVMIFLQKKERTTIFIEIKSNKSTFIRNKAQIAHRNLL